MDNKRIKTIAVASHPHLAEAAEEGANIVSFLEERNISAQHFLLNDEKLRESFKNRENDLLIVLGGDGTVLRAGHLCAPNDVPILAINVGHFGFLIEVPKQSWRAKLSDLLNGSYWLEERMMLRAEHWRDGKSLGSWEVLNEAMIGRGEVARPVHLETDLDGSPLTTYVADGLVVATPTGSTAYALAAGGPILPPELRNILIIPVAPHLSLDRAIVLAEGSDIGVTVRSDHQVLLSIDGKHPIELERGDCIKVQASKYTVQFVRFQDRGYFYRHLIQLMDKHPSAGEN